MTGSSLDVIFRGSSWQGRLGSEKKENNKQSLIDLTASVSSAQSLVSLAASVSSAQSVHFLHLAKRVSCLKLWNPRPDCTFGEL